MKVNTISTAFTTPLIEESRDFYTRYLAAVVTFDCGWYLNLDLGRNAGSIQFMAPVRPEHQLSSSAGLTFNILVDDVDLWYAGLTEMGLAPVLPLEDHPWGDRGFGIKDPNGITIYLYSEIEPTAEFGKYFIRQSDS